MSNKLLKLLKFPKFILYKNYKINYVIKKLCKSNLFF